MRIYSLQFFMHYPELAYRMAMMVPPQWRGSSVQVFRRDQPLLARTVLQRTFFVMGAVNLIWQNIGMIIFVLLPSRTATATATTTIGNVSEIAIVARALPLVAELSETGGIMSLSLVGACKLGMLFWYGDRIATLLAEFQAIFPSAAEQRRIAHLALFRVPYFAGVAERQMRRTVLFFVYAYCHYNAMPLIEAAFELLASDKRFLYRYQSNTWYPWQSARNAESWLSFGAAFLCQMQASLTGLGVILGIEFLFCVFVTQMQLHYDYLANALLTIDATDRTANDKLKQLIAHHSRLLRYSKEINSIFNLSFLVNFTTSTIAICMMGFSMVMISPVHAIKYSVGLLAFLVFMLFTIHNGSALTAASDQLCPAAFCGNWYAGDRDYRRMIHIVMMRTGDCNMLRAYGLVDVSMATYMAILRLSYRLFTFMSALG